jgi:hypothetical protein
MELAFGTRRASGLVVPPAMAQAIFPVRLEPEGPPVVSGTLLNDYRSHGHSLDTIAPLYPFSPVGLHSELESATHLQGHEHGISMVFNFICLNCCEYEAAIPASWIRERAPPSATRLRFPSLIYLFVMIRSDEWVCPHCTSLDWKPLMFQSVSYETIHLYLCNEPVCSSELRVPSASGRYVYFCWNCQGLRSWTRATGECSCRFPILPYRDAWLQVNQHAYELQSQVHLMGHFSPISPPGTPEPLPESPIFEGASPISSSPISSPDV